MKILPNFITHNGGLKLLALIISVVLYFVIRFAIEEGDTKGTSSGISTSIQRLLNTPKETTNSPAINPKK